MLLNYHGADTDPGELNQWLNENGGFGENEWIKHFKLEDYPGVALQYDYDHHGSTDSSVIDTYLANDWPVVLQIEEEHFVLALKKTDEGYRTHDPSSCAEGQLVQGYTEFLSIRPYKPR